VALNLIGYGLEGRRINKRCRRSGCQRLQA
jgi:hypothetical protein